VGVYIEGILAGVSRYVLIPNSLDLADIAVLIRNSFRGRGPSTKIVSCIVEEIRRKGYCPRYRVKEDNFASRAIADKLGFKKVHQVKVWDVSSVN